MKPNDKVIPPAEFNRPDANLESLMGEADFGNHVRAKIAGEGRDAYAEIRFDPGYVDSADMDRVQAVTYDLAQAIDALQLDNWKSLTIPNESETDEAWIANSALDGDRNQYFGILAKGDVVTVRKTPHLVSGVTQDRILRGYVKMLQKSRT